MEKKEEKRIQPTSEAEVHQMLEELCEILKRFSEREDIIVFGMVFRMDKDGICGSPVANFGEDYWTKFTACLANILGSADGPFSLELMTSIVSALNCAIRGDSDFAGMIKEVVIPYLMEAIESSEADNPGTEEPKIIKINVKNGGHLS